MNSINHGTINLEATLATLKRKGMGPVANLLQCLIDNQFHAMRHHVTSTISESVEWIKWKEEKSVDDRAPSLPELQRVHDPYYGIRS